MTGDPLVDLAISAAGVALLVIIARLAFGGARAIVDQTSAADRLFFDEPDFAPTAWLIDADARAALAVNDRGEIAIVKALGDGLATRRAPAGALDARIDGEALVIAAPDPTFNATRVKTQSERAAAWRERLRRGPS